jgi:hypothetical protein
MAEQKPEQKTETTTPSSQTADVQAAQRAGVKESEVKASRYDAGLDQLAGHQAHIDAWANSDEGKQFIADAKDAEKKVAEAEKTRQEAVDSKTGLSDAEKKYQEMVKKG